MKHLALCVALAATPLQAASITASHYQTAARSDTPLRSLLAPAVAQALARSPQLARSQAAEAAAHAELQGAQGRRLPQLGVSATSNSAAFGAHAETLPRQGHGVRLEVVTPLYDGGGRRANIEGQRQLFEATSQAREQASQDLAWQVVALMLEAGRDSALVELASEYQARMADLVSRLSEIVRADPGRASELTQARARLLQARAALDAAQAQRQEAHLGLVSLLGDSGEVAVPGTHWALSPMPLEQLLQRIHSHPAVRSSEALAQAAQAQAYVAHSQALPQLDWVVGKSLESDALGREQPWSTHLSLRWAAFDGGTARAAQRASLQRAQMADEDRRLALQQLDYQVREAEQAAQVASERAHLYGRLSQESAKIRQAFFEQWYQLGRRTLLDVLASETDHFGNRQVEVSSRFEAASATLRGYWRAGMLLEWLATDG